MEESFGCEGCLLGLAGRAAAAGDGLGLFGAGEGYCGEYRCDGHEDSEYGFTHSCLLEGRRGVTFEAMSDGPPRQPKLKPVL
jgi:hypothetical protein